MTIQSIINQYDFNLEYAKALVHDLTEEQMTIVPAAGLDNHPAFTIGHLISGSADLVQDLGGAFEMPDKWAELFVRRGPGDPRKPNLEKSKYPSKHELINELENQHNKVKTLLEGLNEKELEEPQAWRFSNFMPTLGDVVTFMCINHEAMHLGQLAAWRRAMGLESALALVKHNKKPYI
ncbi:DinB family protein [Aestuariivivens insulae]|uniref:DinB family protein n=1 Tax=Aestuariivivens insulae TaxID=1621988 RepID=UPI001F5A9EAC|nr:DinB family protein [Aestuariivivens insulae]